MAPALAQATDVQATLDRNSVQLGETVTLNLRVQNAGGGMAMPDLSALSQDFSILGTSQNSSLSVVNGAATSTLTFGVALRPKHVGTLQIPPLGVAGGLTQPLQLQVSAPDPTAAAATNQNVFMEAQVDPQRGYVGQQLSYVVRLYYATSISNGALSAPQLDGVEVSRMGDDLNYDAERGGRTYHVLERRYALIPQRAGRIEIPAADFQGEAIDPNDPNSFFGSSTPVAASAPAVSIDVQATPADWGKSAWLPARQLSLDMDGWPGAQDQVRVGQPLNLTMTLQATGLAFESLPALSLPPLDGAKTYPDKPVTGTRQDGQWLVGRRQQTFAIVPERAGTLTIPATTLKWWNVLTDRVEVAQIPAHDVTVLPAVGAAAVQTSIPDTASTGNAAPASNAPPSGTPWRWIALGSVGLWLLSVLVWWWRRRRRVPSTTVQVTATISPRQCQLSFLAAARGNDAMALAHSLLKWARAERPAIQHLGELAAALDDAAQREAIAALQRRCYGGAPMAGDGTGLVAAFKRGFVWRAADAGDEASALPPLYPFKLH
ncbi:protein BatD [Rhodanobacter glycinis]|uniref:Protein BatD n=2 Tax=Rhodanobacter glycinis TaxID=582702 RepID=A0A502CJJ1_9GAMM|nr:BatD family protein [Rhodanobacter glycinis]TPG11946.1 protein BatD [Rhodanobacter glycinis]TPG47911.1 protein BatD [Rhodanobacter glycinis]